MRRGTAQGLRRMRAAWADVLYPPACMVCAAAVADARGLCAACWSETELISGTACDGCGTPMALALRSGEAVRCDFCEGGGIAWNRGRAAALYGGGARAMVLALKHGDRPDIARTAALWMARRGRALLAEADMLVPVPLHWVRFLGRRYNQSAEIAREIARLTALPHAPAALRRIRATPMQKASQHVRAANVAGAFAVPPHMRGGVRGRRIVLVDDVMTTGATLNAAAGALLTAGAAQVDTLVFARVVPGRDGVT